MKTAEQLRLAADGARTANWKRWGPYLSERQWGTVREDYSADGRAWEYFPHDHARSRAYRWGEDGLLGITDRECRLCFALALWNGRDPILKERLFGLTNHEGNHGEDVKECYFYLDNTPTHSYMRALYKYPHAAFPYERLVTENRRRTVMDREFELVDTGVFDDNRYCDVFIEYAKGAPDDLLIRISAHNRGPEPQALHLLPTLWLRNTWSTGRKADHYWPRGRLSRAGAGVLAEHATLGRYRFDAAPASDGSVPTWLYTENETNMGRLYGVPSAQPYVKDAFDQYLVHGRSEAVNPAGVGTKVAPHYELLVAGGASVTLTLRLSSEGTSSATPFDAQFEQIFAQRASETDEFYRAAAPAAVTDEERRVLRQAYAGLLWTKQFYQYVVREWLEGDPAFPPPPAGRSHGRNSDWQHLFNNDVLLMPDSWEYPWYAAWDLAFHTIPMAHIDPAYAKEQLLLLLREWYMHPSGEMPAYEWALGDVNPPVHAWACWRVYKMTGGPGGRDRLFLKRAFQKLMLNFTWWVNRKDVDGRHLFAGGFLGLDNIGVFDRSMRFPDGTRLEQADGTAWMAFYCGTLLSMALELATTDPEYEDIASTFFEHFVAITDAMNTLGGTGLWNEEDGFYYDLLHVGDSQRYLALRSMVGIIPLFAVEILEDAHIERLPGFTKRLRWFLENRADLARHIAYMDGGHATGAHRLLAIPSRDRLERVLRYVLDERELLARFGVRSLSRVYETHPYTLQTDGHVLEVRYVAGESQTVLFGGNSNWRGPVWFPLNYLLIEALERYHHFYGDTLRVECPTGSGQLMNLSEVAHELQRRLTALFFPEADKGRPCHGGDPRFAHDPNWRDLLLFHEYFDGDAGRGIGASHQTGWTALVVRGIEDEGKRRGRGAERRG